MAFSAATTIEAACASDEASTTGVVESVLAAVQPFNRFPWEGHEIDRKMPSNSR